MRPLRHFALSANYGLRWLGTSAKAKADRATRCHRPCSSPVCVCSHRRPSCLETRGPLQLYPRIATNDTSERSGTLAAIIAAGDARKDRYVDADRMPDADVSAHRKRLNAPWPGLADRSKRLFIISKALLIDDGCTAQAIVPAYSGLPPRGVSGEGVSALT
jgi:hypothetical protein